MTNGESTPGLRRRLSFELGLTIMLTALTVLLTYMIFPPRSWWLAAFFCLSPWTIALLRVERAWVVHWCSFIGGWLFFMIGLRWLMPVTGLGYIALAFYLAIFWPLAGWGVRTARRLGIGPTWSLPVAWVATEWLRGTLMTGFPWLLLGHAWYQQLELIQIADFVGAYGVSFVAAMINGALAELYLGLRKHAARPPRWKTVGSVTAAALLLLATLGYGYLRLSDPPLREGPRVAVVQHDFPLSNIPPYGDHPTAIFAKYVSLAAEAAYADPDLLVFPETVWNAVQNADFLEVEHRAVDGIPPHAYSFGRLVHNGISAFARADYRPVNEIIGQFERTLQRAGRDVRLPRLPEPAGDPVTTVVGAISVEVLPESSYPKMKRFNSALVYDPDGTQRAARYDKMHLVPFGEIVPFRNAKVYGIDLHWLYRWLNSLSPFSGKDGTFEYSLWPGAAPTVFDLKLDGGETAKFGVPICYEDVMPYVVRRFVWSAEEGKRVDFLVNISNDGWFLHSDELPQHLAICTFRAVENRVGIARAVNTGISGFITPTGRIYSTVEQDGRWYTPGGPGAVGFQVASVMVDDRVSFYSRYGDWLAVLCTLLATLLWFGGMFTRWVLGAAARIRGWMGGRRPGDSETMAS